MSAARSSFKAEVWKAGRLVRRETYAVEFGNRFVAVTQSQRSETRPDVLVRCSFVARPWGFERARVTLSSSAGQRTDEVECEQGRELAWVTHLGVREPRRVTPSRGFTLLDGPSPLFDYVSLFLILGVCEGESVEHRVNRFDPESGGIESLSYTFRRTRAGAEIVKPGILAAPATITTPEGDVPLLAYEADGERTVFAPIEDAAGLVTG